MKKLSKPAYLSPAYLLLGAVGMVLHWWLFTGVEDEISWLLPAWTLPQILLLALSALAIVAAFPLVRGTRIGFSSRVLETVSSLFFAVGTASLATVQGLTGPETLLRIYRIMAIVGAVALAASAVFAALGKKIPFLLELIPCLVALAQLLVCYQQWSEIPQMMNYAMGLGAIVCLLLSCYFRMARAADLPGKSWHNAIGLIGVYFCAAATANATFSYYFCTAAVWLASEYAGMLPAEDGHAA